MDEILKNQAEEYDASQIQVLEGLEAVRKRPGMYIGSTSASGLHHLVYEIVDNSIDEALAGFCDHIKVWINPGNSITVIDNGRGIPVDIQAQTGKSALEVVFTVLHAGGKFGGGGYKVSGGLHGVGASVVNALSEWLEVEVCDGKNRYYQRFEHGKETAPLAKLEETERHGTQVIKLLGKDPRLHLLDDTHNIVHSDIGERHPDGGIHRALNNLTLCQHLSRRFLIRCNQARDTKLRATKITHNNNQAVGHLLRK